jgi:hypothetical protein
MSTDHFTVRSLSKGVCAMGVYDLAVRNLLNSEQAAAGSHPE